MSQHRYQQRITCRAEKTGSRKAAISPYQRTVGSGPAYRRLSLAEDEDIINLSDPPIIQLAPIRFCRHLLKNMAGLTIRLPMIITVDLSLPMWPKEGTILFIMPIPIIPKYPTELLCAISFITLSRRYCLRWLLRHRMTGVAAQLCDDKRSGCFRLPGFF